MSQQVVRRSGAASAAEDPSMDNKTSIGSMTEAETETRQLGKEFRPGVECIVD